MLGRFIAGCLLVLSLAAAPFLLPQANRTEAAAPIDDEVVCLKGPGARPAPAASRPLEQLLGSRDLRDLWTAVALLAAADRPAPPEAASRLLDAFLDGRMDFAAGWARHRLESMAPAEQVSIGSRARNLDRTLILLDRPSDALVRLFVSRAEDPAAHADAARRLAARIEPLVADPALGRRAWNLLRAARVDSTGALALLADRVGDDDWARAEVAGMGTAADRVLLDRLSSPDRRLRAAAAWLLALASPDAHAESVLRAAAAETLTDAVPGNAAFAVRALAALGDRARPLARILLRSADDQAVACGLDVLLRTGGASSQEHELAAPAIDRLVRSHGDETGLAAELRGSPGEGGGAARVAGAPDSLRAGQAPAVGN